MKTFLIIRLCPVHGYESCGEEAPVEETASDEGGGFTCSACFSSLDGDFDLCSSCEEREAREHCQAG
jgi:hypothetical protein